MKSHRRSEPTDAEVRAILIAAMAEVGADPALIYAFQRTGVYVCEENERRLSKQAWQRGTWLWMSITKHSSDRLSKASRRKPNVDGNSRARYLGCTRESISHRKLIRTERSEKEPNCFRDGAGLRSIPQRA